MHDRFAKPAKVRQPHRYEWLWEPLESDATFVLRSMFGTKAAYLDGQLMLCFCGGEEPWRGVLVCTDHIHHAALLAEFPALKPHSILPKWLYLAETVDCFETMAAQLVSLARRRDPRLGVLPSVRKKKPANKRPTKRAKLR